MTSESDVQEKARQLLVAHGHYPDLSPRSQDLMRYACRDGNAEVVAGYLHLGMSTETRDDWSQATPLLVAVEGDNPAIVSMLVEAGADMDARDGDGDTPLHTAVNWDHPQVAELLIELGSPVDTVNSNDKTPLVSALENGNEPAVTLLLEGGADPSFCAPEAAAPLFAAREHCPHLIDVLLEAGASPDDREPVHGNTLLMVAATNGDAALVDKLLEAGADVDVENHFGWTAAASARWEGHDHLADHLAEASVDAGELAVLRAVESGDYSGLEAYLADGGDPDLRTPTGQSMLMFAAGANEEPDQDVVRLLLDAGASVDLVAQFGGTALSSAADVQMVDLLIEAGATPDERPGHSEALLGACYEDQPERVRRLLEAGASIDSRDSFGESALHKAVSFDCIGIVDVLLEADADTELLNSIGDTPLGYAVEWGKKAIVERLIAGGADIDGTNHSDEAPLHRVCKTHYTGVDESTYLEIGRLLLDAGADCSAVSHVGQTPAESARFNNNDDALALVSDFLTVERLAAAGERLGLDPGDRSTELFDALVETETAETVCEWIRRGEHHIALRLIEAGVVERIEPAPNLDPVKIAADQGDAELLRALCEAGAPIDIVSQYGYTPLFQAITQGQTQCVEVLIEAGADVESRLSNNPAIVVAAGGQHFDIVRRLAEAGADVDPLPAGSSALIGAAKGESVEFVNWLLEHGVNLEVCDTGRRCALHHAVDNGQTAIVRALVEAGACLDTADKEEMTPLHLAAKEGRAEIVRVLLEAGADATKLDASGATAQAYAVGRKEVSAVFDELAPDTGNAPGLEIDALVDDTERSELIEAVYLDDARRLAELLGAGADPHQTNYRGDSALTIAAKRGNMEAVRALCEAGADVAHTGPSGQSAHSISLTKNHPDGLKELLEEHGAEMAMAAIEGQIGVMQGQSDFLGALRRGELVTIARLLDEHAVDIHSLSDGRTPLGVAVECEDAEVVELLLAKGANPKVAHYLGGPTPLEMARQNEFDEGLEAMGEALRE